QPAGPGGRNPAARRSPGVPQRTVRVLELHLRRNPFRRFLRDRQAVAAVEFALILPLLLTLYFGTVEAASLYSVDRRVATVASTMADLISRERGCISTEKLNSYFNAA